MTTMTSHSTACLPATARKSLLARLVELNAVYRQRQSLKRFDAARLADLGLTRLQANAEAERSFWDAPEHWTK